VISYEPSFDPRIDPTWPYHDQGQWFHLDESIKHHVYDVHGTIRFYHKPFYDFLWDPTCSGSFCVNTSTIYCKFFDHFIQYHHHYASSYAIDSLSMYFLPLHLSLNLPVIPDLVSALGLIGSSTSLSLSWPHETEFADSYLKLATFSILSLWSSWDDPDFSRFLEELPFALLQRLADIDYRKSLIANLMWSDLSDPSPAFIVGIPATAQTLTPTVIECIRTFDQLVPAAFLLYVLKMITHNEFTHTFPGCQYIGESKGHPSICSSLWLEPSLSASSHSLPQKFSEEKQWAL